jgi:hypothetical protein
MSDQTNAAAAAHRWREMARIFAETIVETTAEVGVPPLVAQAGAVTAAVALSINLGAAPSQVIVQLLKTWAGMAAVGATASEGDAERVAQEAMGRAMRMPPAEGRAN